MEGELDDRIGRPARFRWSINEGKERKRHILFDTLGLSIGVVSRWQAGRIGVRLDRSLKSPTDTVLLH